MKNDRFRIYGIRKEQTIKVIENVGEKIIERKLTPNKISNLDKFIIRGKQQKVVKFSIEKPERFIIEGFEKEEEPEENIEESVVEISILTKPKKILPNIIKRLERFNITGIEQTKEEFVPVKRKGFVEKIKPLFWIMFAVIPATTATPATGVSIFKKFIRKAEKRFASLTSGLLAREKKYWRI